MMVSERRIAANRRNAQLSTGPRTPAGRAKSSMNALRHGITGQVSIMTTEDRAAHDNFIQELTDRLRPEDALELQFASLIAEDFWRLQRIRAVENDMLALGNFSDAAEIDVDHPEIHTSLTRARTFVDRSKDFERLTLYEQRITRALEKNRRQLDELQAERKRLRQEALDQACLLHQVPAARKQAGKTQADETQSDDSQHNYAQYYDDNPSDASTPSQPVDPTATDNGFVFSSGEIERAIDRRSRLLKAGMIQTRADALIRARVKGELAAA
jgi:hypothetical protein